MKILKFSHDYDKLQSLQHGEVITTIRKQLYNRYVGQIVDVRLRYTHLCYAKIIDIQKRKLFELSDKLLVQDTKPFAKNRSEAIHFISSFYRHPLQPTTTVFVIYLKKVEVLML